MGTYRVPGKDADIHLDASLEADSMANRSAQSALEDSRATREARHQIEKHSKRMVWKEVVSCVIRL